MRKIQAEQTFDLPTALAPTNLNSRDANYSSYVAQIEANKGALLKFSPYSSRGVINPIFLQPKNNDSSNANHPMQKDASPSFFGLSAGNQATPERASPSFFGLSADGQNAAGINPNSNNGEFSLNNFVSHRNNPNAATGPDPQRITNASNAYRYIANYNHIDPQQLAHAVTPNELAARSPTIDGHNFFNDYVSGVAVQPATPIASSGTLGVSSQGTGNFLDNTPRPQQQQTPGFSMGGLVGDMQQPTGIPMLGYATGGAVGQPPAGLAPQQAGTGAPPMQGGPMGANAAPPSPVNPQMFHAQAADLLQQHPEIKQQIQQAVQQAMASGQLTMQEAQMGVQLCQACINNPALWPQLRAFAIQNGLATGDQIPQQYDQGLVMAILIAAKAVGADSGQGAQGAGGPQGRFATGGLISGPGSGTSDSIPAKTNTGDSIKVSNGEFIIPEHVVKAKGTDFFEKMIESYNPNAGTGTK